jgi:hypothetical protein
MPKLSSKAIAENMSAAEDLKNFMREISKSQDTMTFISEEGGTLKYSHGFNKGIITPLYVFTCRDGFSDNPQGLNVREARYMALASRVLKNAEKYGSPLAVLTHSHADDVMRNVGTTVKSAKY